jgi:hypothetical protein
MTTTAPVPTGYEHEPADNSVYLKIEPNSSARLRLASAPILFVDTFDDGTKADRWGWIVILKTVVDGKPVRTVKAFKAGVMIYKAIRALATNEEWGDPSGYDVTITRTGSGKETKYTVVPSPAKSMTDEEKKLVADANLDLGALFIKGGTATTATAEAPDPFED